MNVKLNDNPRVSVVYDGTISNASDSCLVTVLEVIGIVIVFGAMWLMQR